MNFLALSDAEYADRKTDLLRSEIMCKRVRARIYLTASGSSVDARKAEAETNADVIAADDELIKATAAFELLKARRQRAEIVVDVFRTLEASRRKA